MAFIHTLFLGSIRGGIKTIKKTGCNKGSYICNRAIIEMMNPPQKPTNICNPLFRPTYRRAEANRPARIIDKSIAQKSDNTPTTFNTIRIATAAPIDVICRLTLHQGNISRQNTSHIIAAIAILRKNSNEGALTSVMAHKR